MYIIEGEISSVAFKVEISLSTDDFPGKLIGFCYLMPRHFKSTTGTVKETIISPVSEAIGEINIEFLVIHPIKQVSYDFAISFAKYWDPQLNCIDIGHRGLGNSSLKAKTKCSPFRENTLMSFKQAYFHGGDMVEMDVQLSKDHIPVIYHDFQIPTLSLPKDSKKKEQLIPIQLKSLSLKELRGLKIGKKVNVFLCCQRRVLHIEMYKVYPSSQSAP
mgnify:CR=1 FL=1